MIRLTTSCRRVLSSLLLRVHEDGVIRFTARCHLHQHRQHQHATASALLTHGTDQCFVENALLKREEKLSPV